jgi:OPA family sugar phosphate sensor protein UhpC-like MFS transporter
MLAAALRFFRTRPDLPPLGDAVEIERSYRRKRWTTFLAITIGYSFFYTTRLSLSVAKKPMLDEGLLGADDLGRIGSVLYFTYAFGRLTNGFLCDRAHLGRFIGTGLLLSALLNLLFGASSTVALFLVLWGLNGWFQSMGSAPCAANLTLWFGRRERGTRYSVWSLAHNLGEGLTFAGTAVLVAAFGWRWGFWGPGLACLLVAVLIYRTVLDRPATYGLPPIETHRGEAARAADAAGESVGRQQIALLRDPVIWALGLASAAMYVVRYGINEWFVLYLQEAKGYDLVAAGLVTSASPIVGALGTLASGTVSDLLLRGRRLPVSLAYSVLLLAGLAAMPWIPPGHPWADALAVSVCGFAIGGLLVFLAGLMAVDAAPRRAAGAAMGVIGVFSYLGAAAQNWVAGVLLEQNRMTVDGREVHDFGPVLALWMGAAAASLLFSLAVAGLSRRRAPI